MLERVSLEELVFDILKENELEQVIKLYDVERTIKTNIEKSKLVFKEVINDSSICMITAKIKGEIIGFAQLQIHKDIFEEYNPYITVWSVRIKKEYRRKRFGTKLFEQIEKIANQNNCEFICLLADKENNVANCFYTKLGFETENGYVKVLKK